MNVNINDASIKLSELIDQAAAGEEVIITNGSCSVRLVPKAQPKNDTTFPFGCMPGIGIADDFDEFGPELHEMFGMKNH